MVSHKMLHSKHLLTLLILRTEKGAILDASGSLIGVSEVIT